MSSTDRDNYPSLDSLDPLLFLLLVSSSRVMLSRGESGRSCPASPQRPCVSHVLFTVCSWFSEAASALSRSPALLSGWDTDLMKQGWMCPAGMLPGSICFLGLIFSAFICVCIWVVEIRSTLAQAGFTLMQTCFLFSYCSSLLVSPRLLFLPDSTSRVDAYRSVSTLQRLGFQHVINSS